MSEELNMVKTVGEEVVKNTPSKKALIVIGGAAIVIIGGAFVIHKIKKSKKTVECKDEHCKVIDLNLSADDKTDKPDDKK